MARRTMNEIEKDYERIITFVNSNSVTSINEIAEGLGLSTFQVKSSLAKHPGAKESIVAQLEENKLAIPTEHHEVVTDFDTGFVIDASITGISNLEDVLSKICVTNAKIILTSITIKELEKLQKFHDEQALDARHILAMAAENPEKFLSVLIDETVGIPDDCIIKYCANNKEKVSLLTSDKTMALKARMYGVKTQYLKQEKDTKPTNSQPTGYSYKEATLTAVEKAGNKLYVDVFNNVHGSLWLISNNLVYTDGVHELKIGDDVFLATKKHEYMTFAHYLITSLSTKNNCKVIYSKRIYKKDKIRNLPQTAYRSFMSDFVQRHDL